MATQETTLKPGDSRTTRPTLRGALGIDIAVAGATHVGAEVMPKVRPGATEKRVTL